MIMTKSSKNKSPVKFLLGLAILFLISSILLGVILIKNQTLVWDQANQEINLLRTKTKTEPQPVYLQLPGAEKIIALKEDYKKDDSLWRIASRVRPLNDRNYRPVLEVAQAAAWQQVSRNEQSIRPELQEPLRQMFADAKAAGYELMIGSGFRSSQQQAAIYNNYVRMRGQAGADKVSARPGTSEHQLGLAVDIAYTDRNCYLKTCFAETGAGKWLAANAHQHGFILRYPRGKEEITGYQFEPWHFRYVGKDLANALHQSGLTLDEAEPYLLEARKNLGYEK